MPANAGRLTPTAPLMEVGEEHSLPQQEEHEKHGERRMLNGPGRHERCVFEAAKWAATTVLAEAGYPTAEERIAGGFDVGRLTADCVHEAKGNVGRAAALGVAAASRLVAMKHGQHQGGDVETEARTEPGNRETSEVA